MFKFFEVIINLLEMVVGFVLNLFDMIIFVITFIAQGVVYATTCIMYLPPWVLPFVEIYRSPLIALAIDLVRSR